MKWVKDRTGRFQERPHYAPEELDSECETFITQFLLARHNKIEFPVKTADLTVMIEQVVEDLDTGADLSAEDGEVDGVTEFRAGKRPTVKISRRLTEASNLENRLRTTLTHEYGHVRFHSFMFDSRSQPLSLFPLEEPSAPHSNKCKRENIIGAVETNWMEWQAGYACSALLIPISFLVEQVKHFREHERLPYSSLAVDSESGQKLITTIAAAFQTSRDAARVRLLQKRFLVENGGRLTSSLF